MLDIKGGPGSGFRGHAGRPGRVGGSAARSEHASYTPTDAPDYSDLPVTAIAKGDFYGVPLEIREHTALKPGTGFSESRPGLLRWTKTQGLIFDCTDFYPSNVHEKVADWLESADAPAMDYFYRYTNNKNEIRLLGEGSLRPSINHASQTSEGGLSVSQHGGYAVQGYRFGYRVRGDVLRFGADGEPVLDMASLEPIEKMQSADALAVDWQIQKDTARQRFLRKTGLSNDQYLSLRNGVQPQDHYGMPWSFPILQPVTKDGKKGGPGSGFRGHAGRPGKVGGSAADGSVRNEPVPAWEANGASMGTLYHGGKRVIAKIDPDLLQRRDSGFFGAGFYLSTFPQGAQNYGGRITYVKLQDDARVLIASQTPSEAPIGLVQTVQEDYLAAGLATGARARGKEDALREEVALIATDHTSWRHAVDAYVNRHGYQVAVYDSEVVVKDLSIIQIQNPKARRAKGGPGQVGGSRSGVQHQQPPEPPRRAAGDPWASPFHDDGGRLVPAKVAKAVARAIQESPGRATHGNTGTNAFFLVGDKIYAYNDWDKIPEAERRQAISVHSHSAENWHEAAAREGRPERFQPLNAADIGIWLGGITKGQFGAADAIILADGRMEILELPGDADPKVLQLRQGKFEKLTEQSVEWRSQEGQRLLHDPAAMAATKLPGYDPYAYKRQATRALAQKYGLVYHEGLRWSEQGALSIRPNSEQIKAAAKQKFTAYGIKPALVDQVFEQFPLPIDSMHGPAHWRRVLENGARLAVQTGARTDVVAYFALLHDSQRRSEGDDYNHGPSAAKFAASLRKRIKLDDAGFAMLTEAMTRHSDSVLNADITVQTSWDADRLDLPRPGVRIKINPTRLSTAAARAMIDYGTAHSQEP